MLGASAAAATTDADGGAFREGPRVHVVVQKPEDGELVVSVGDEAALAATLREQMATAGKVGNGFLVATLVLGGVAAWLFLSYLS